MPGHRPHEQILSVKPKISKNIAERKMIVLVCYDISAVDQCSGFFDKEVLDDVMDELHSIGVDPMACRFFKKLSANTESGLVVKTMLVISSARGVEAQQREVHSTCPGN